MSAKHEPKTETRRIDEDEAETARLRELAEKLGAVSPSDTPYDPRAFSNLAKRIS